MAESNLKLFNGESIDMFWWPRESGTRGYRSTNIDKGNAYGAYHFDRRYTLIPFMRYCVEYDDIGYSEFNKFINMDPKDLVNNEDLAELWKSFCDRNFEEFSKLQDEYSYYASYIPAKNHAIESGVPIDEYSPILKGSLWSFAIKSGPKSGAKKLINAYNNSSNKEELRLLKSSYGSYSNQDSNRWSTSSNVSQYSDAVKIYKSTYMKIEEEKELIINDKPQNIENNKLPNNFTKCEESISNPIIEVEQLIIEEEVIKETPDEDIVPIVKEEDKILIVKEDPVDVEKDEETVDEDIIVDNDSGKFKVCTGWKSGYAVGQMGAYGNYDIAKENCNKISKSTGRIYYVYNSKGIRLYMNDPKAEKKDVPGGYKVGTAYANGAVINQKGEFTNYENAKNFTDKLSKRELISYKIFLNGILQYTASTK